MREGEQWVGGEGDRWVGRSRGHACASWRVEHTPPGECVLVVAQPLTHLGGDDFSPPLCCRALGGAPGPLGEALGGLDLRE